MKGEVAAGRARRRKSVLYFAKLQLEGAVLDKEDGPRMTICQRCLGTFYVMADKDPCAFCNGCKDAVLDMLAEAVVKGSKR